MIIAFDGPAGSGKTTISKELSKLLNFPCLNTGNMYRSVAYISIENDISSIEQLSKKIKNIKFEFVLSEGSYKLLLGNKDFSEVINDPSILYHTSKIARHQEIRDILIKKQREIISNRNIIVEGRDIGTVVAPNAEYKFFIDANVDIRTKRLFSMLPQNKKDNTTLEDLKLEIINIDKRDKIFDILNDNETYIHYITSNYSSEFEAEKIRDKYFAGFL